MADERTVLILGAGASWAYGFPTGTELIRRTCQDFVSKAPRLAEPRLSPELAKSQAKDFVDTLQTAQVNSIDDFLEDHEGFRSIGRLAIAATLLPSEDDDHLFGRGEKRQRDHWYQHFWDWLAADGYDSLASRLISVVTFNYDRSLERYLYMAIQKRFNKGEQEAADLVNRLRIVHVHGRLGRLDWQSDSIAGEDPEPVVPFGGVPADSSNFREMVMRAARSIKIIYEDVERTPALVRARGYLGDAKTVLFLGFGYHRVNLKRLFKGLALQPHITLAGTCFDLSDAEINRNVLGRLLPLLNPEGCTPPEASRAKHAENGEMRSRFEGQYNASTEQVDWAPATIVISSGSWLVELELEFRSCMNLEFLRRTPYLLRR